VRLAPIFVLALALAACGHSASSDHASHATAKADDPSCPVLVAGTSVAVEDLANGAAFVFVTTGDVADVRRRAAKLADMHAHHDGPPSAMGMMIETPSTAAEKDIDNGARVELVATNPGDAAKLQSELRMHAQHLASGSCEMAM
jgi:hypothetical protein